MKTKLNNNIKLYITAFLAAGLISPAHETLAKSKVKKTAPGLQKIHQSLEAENAELHKQLADSQIKEEELIKAAQAIPVAKSDVKNNPFGTTEPPSRQEQSVVPEMSCGANMGKTKTEPGEQFLYNPVLAGTEMFTAQPKGIWMFNTKWGHSQQDGLQAGTSPVSESQASTTRVWAVPSHKTMDAFKFMGSYGITDQLTLMGIINYQANGLQQMPQDRRINGQPNIYSTSPVNTSGLGDTELDAIYKIHDSKLGKVTGTVGLSIPTGSTSQESTAADGYGYRAPYDMQPGSGTVDLKPALTYNWITDNALWNLGGQASGIVHTGTNRGWAYGNSLNLSTWGQRAFGPATTWVRLKYTDTAQIRGQDPNIQMLMEPKRWSSSTPDADPANYGGQILNAFIGASYKYNAFSFGLEGGVPAYQNLNGLQLKNSWQITSGFQAMF